MASSDYLLAVADFIATRGDQISLHSGDPGTTGADEVSGGGYSRATPTWGAAQIVSGGAHDGKARVAANPLQMNAPGGVSITHYGVWKSGVFQYGRPLDPGVTLNSPGIIDVTPVHYYDLT